MAEQDATYEEIRRREMRLREYDEMRRRQDEDDMRVEQEYKRLKAACDESEREYDIAEKAYERAVDYNRYLERKLIEATRLNQNTDKLVQDVQKSRDEVKRLKDIEQKINAQYMMHLARMAAY